MKGTCQGKEQTNGTVPKSCTSHTDCTATKGATKEECVCVNDEAGSSYCKLIGLMKFRLETLSSAI